MVVFTQGGLYGAMTTDGEELAEAAYTQLVSNGEGGFLALTTPCFDDQGDGLYRIDETGAVSATGVQTLGTLSWFSNGLMAAAFGGKTAFTAMWTPPASGRSARSLPMPGRSSAGGRWPLDHGLRPHRRNGQLGAHPQVS